MAGVEKSMRVNFEIMVKHEANVNVKDVRDVQAPLLVMAGYTSCKEQLELLLDEGAGIEGIDNQGTQALIAAADSGDKESVAMLLAREANIQPFRRSLAPLGTAADAAQLDCINMLLEVDEDFNKKGRRERVSFASVRVWKYRVSAETS